MNTIIRSMRETDIDKVYAIEANAHIAPWSRDIIRDCVLIGYDCRVMEVNEGEGHFLVGYIISRLARTEYHILNLCITPSFQGKGLGASLLQKVIDSLKNNKQINSMVLEVRPSNHKAIHLYRSMGFQQVDIKKNYYKEEDNMEDAIFLKKTL